VFYFIEERKTASFVVVIRESTNNRKINQKINYDHFCIKKVFFFEAWGFSS